MSQEGFDWRKMQVRKLFVSSFFLITVLFRKLCYGSDPDESSTFIDFSCFLSINNGQDSWTPIRTFRNQIRDFEDPTVSLSLDFESNEELVPKLFVKIFEKMVRIKYTVDRNGDGEDKLSTLEIL